ncbi:hypothetical protein Pint_11157 [Pistacia integerrima]|uniref:Uncharacterized protein n=1 Tax=Pistacia integerrima TaxID=434235 RepID=A0ACC0XIJ8_9ROSI|nr:hypothetical protein Pint_11157 [Pistacia integerrima]
MMRMMINDNMCKKGTDSVFVEGHMPIGTFSWLFQQQDQVIPGMTLDNAVNIMQETHYNGLSVVIICSQADAEDHCMQLRGNGLLSSVEPISGGGC